MKKKDKKTPKPTPVPSEPVPFWKYPAVWAVAAWALFVLFKFDAKFPVSADAALQLVGNAGDVSVGKFLKIFFIDLQSLLFLAAFLGSAGGWGGLVVPNPTENPLSLGERTTLSTAVGLIFLSMAVYIVGWFPGGYRPGPLWLFSSVYVAGGLWLNRSVLTAWRTELPHIRVINYFQSPVNFLIALLIFFPIAMAFVPELFYDSLVYHMGLPQMFINEGRIVDTPFVYFSRFPMLLHMLYTLGLGLDGGSALPKLFNVSFLFLGLAGFVLLARRLGAERSVRWAIVLVLSIPVVQLNIWSTAIDAAMGTMTILGLLVFFIWKQRGFVSLRFAVLMGLCLGAVFGLKYTGVVVLLSAGVLFLFVRDSENRISYKVQAALIFGVVVFLVVVPYLTRNYVWTGNPTYPILSKIFESRNINPVHMKNEQDLVGRSVPKTPLQLMAFPWTQTMLDISSFNFIGPLTLATLPVLLLIPWARVKEHKELFVFCALYFLIALRFSGDIRYLLPGFYTLGLILSMALGETWNIKPIGGAVLRSVLLILVGYQIVWICQSLQSLYDPLPVLLGSKSRADYSITMHNGLNLWPWNIISDNLKKLPDPCRVYILGNEQVYGFPRRFVYSSVHDYTPLVLWANDAGNKDGLRDKIKQEGVTHFLVNVPEAMRLKGYNLFPWTESGLRAFVDFANAHLALIDVKPISGYNNSLFLFEVRDALDGPPAVGDFGRFFKDILNLEPPKPLPQ